MKQLIDLNGELTTEGKVVVNDILENMIPIFERYLDDEYNIFEVLGVMTSALINAQKQAWLNKGMHKK